MTCCRAGSAATSRSSDLLATRPRSCRPDPQQVSGQTWCAEPTLESISTLAAYVGSMTLSLPPVSAVHAGREAGDAVPNRRSRPYSLPSRWRCRIVELMHPLEEPVRRRCAVPLPQRRHRGAALDELAQCRGLERLASR